MSDAIFRHWAMLEKIPRAPAKISTMELQARLEATGYRTSARSIQRDLIKLSNFFPLICDDRSKPYGWSWMKDGPLMNLPALDPRSALTLLLVKMFIADTLPVNLQNYLAPHFEFAKNTLNAPHNAAFADWPKKVMIAPRTQTLIPATIDDQVLAMVYQALFENRAFCASYEHKPSKTNKNYDYINPLGLVLRHGVIYLICTFYKYQDIRQLALHRLTSAQLLDDPAIKPKGFNLKRYVTETQGMDIPYSDQTIKVKLKFDAAAAAHLFETPLSRDQTITPLDDNYCVVTASVADTAQLRWWILGFGDQVEVLAPDSLRKSFAEIAKNLNIAYSG